MNTIENFKWFCSFLSVFHPQRERERERERERLIYYNTKKRAIEALE